MVISVLLVDDDETVRDTLGDFFRSLDWVVHLAATGTEGRRLAAEHSPDVALVDLRLPDGDGLRLVEALRADDAEMAILVLTGHADVATAVRAMRLGAADLLEKPVDLELLRAAVEQAAERVRERRELVHLRGRQAARDDVAGVWTLPGFERLVELAARNADVPVLLLGESGTGKTVVARQIHDRSPRAAAPFVAVNCASLAPALLESELFGHERGAFTDARAAKRGLLEIADGGTLLLDEIADLAPAAQPKLLTVIEDGVFRRVGGTTTRRADVRIVAATNTPLRGAVEEGRFRSDLFYRLQVLSIELPPLRERRDEILPLAKALLPRGARLAPSAHDALVAYDWPGNVRELKNILWRAAILADGEPITPVHLALPLASLPGSSRLAAARNAATTPIRGRVVAGVTPLVEAERRAISDALRATGGNKRRAAALLGIARSTLLDKVRRLGLT
ncbi:MAG: sigma-54-dependent Fis family transcriptional regulator [Gemmatimonadaceae bacterium]|nr:sigma-54-dependent Fis family transcriptional regulator [Gemmatimonadaceae bacterium]NUQ92269.1 sigma-54-dependent Fis family transcriptional regulator [Gemmatimonadaceae bacterium]